MIAESLEHMFNYGNNDDTTQIGNTESYGADAELVKYITEPTHDYCNNYSVCSESNVQAHWSRYFDRVTERVHTKVMATTGDKIKKTLHEFSNLLTDTQATSKSQAIIVQIIWNKDAVVTPNAIFKGKKLFIERISYCCCLFGVSMIKHNFGFHVF